MQIGRMFWIFCLIICLLSPFPSIASDVKDSAANRVVNGIISFTYWPGLKMRPLLCVLPGSRHISIASSTGGNAYNVVYLASESELQSRHCDAVYFGGQLPKDQERLLGEIRNRPVLAISENNPECTIGASFCLTFQKGGAVFSVNIDSLTRSGVKVNPEVLLLSREGNQ